MPGPLAEKMLAWQNWTINKASFRTTIPGGLMWGVTFGLSSTPIFPGCLLRLPKYL